MIFILCDIFKHQESETVKFIFVISVDVVIEFVVTDNTHTAQWLMSSLRFIISTPHSEWVRASERASWKHSTKNTANHLKCPVKKASAASRHLFHFLFNFTSLMSVQHYNLLRSTHKTIDKMLFCLDSKFEVNRSWKKWDCRLTLHFWVYSLHQHTNSLSPSHDSMLSRQFHCNQNNEQQWNGQKPSHRKHKARRD